MLSDEEKRELLDNAASKALQAEFEALRRNSRPADPKNLDLDAYISFLTSFSRAFPTSASSRPVTGTFLL